MGASTHAIATQCGSAQAADIAHLIEGVKGRDPAALRALYVAYSRRVQSYAFQVLRDEHAAEDVVHDVFLRVWRYAATYDAAKGAKPEAWLFQIARNVALNEVAQRARMVAAEAPETEPGAMDSEWDTWDAQSRISDGADSRGAAFGRALEELPSHCRQVLHLRFHEGLTNPEIARHLGVPVGTAKTWLRRGLLQMRANLKVVVAGDRQEEWI
jgi:RNA polymerase sigma-70 factor (ECF subfamily)